MAPEHPQRDSVPMTVGRETDGRSVLEDFSPVKPAPDGAFPKADMPAANIPELRKKDKEKRRSGIAWGPGGQGAGSAWIGGGGAIGDGAAAGIFGSGRIAAALAQAFGGSGTALGDFLLSRFGAYLVLAAMLAAAGAMALIGLGLYGAWTAGGRTASSSAAFPLLDGIATSLRIKDPRNRSLDYLSKANEGELKFGQDLATGIKPEAPKEAAGEAEKAPVNPPTMDQALEQARTAAQSGLDASRGSFIKKLTSDTSQLGGAGAGLKSGLGGFKLKSGTGNALPKFEARNKLAMMKKSPGLRAGNMTRRGVRTSRALGQLRFARTLSNTGAQARNEASSQYATQAFDQGVTQGGDVPTPINGPTGTGSSTVVPPGAGAPPPLPTPPQIHNPQDVTPYQPYTNQGMQLGNMAKMLRMMGLMMMMIGAILIAVGVALLSNPFTAPIGAALIGAGAALIMMGLMMLMMAQSMAKMAGALSKNVIDGQYGQTEQGKITAERAQANADGRSYDPSAHDKNIQNGFDKTHQGVHQAIQDEVGNSGYGVDGNGQPINQGGGAAKP